MKSLTAESMSRIVKIALDSGEADCLEMAEEIFKNYRLQIYLSPKWSATLAGEAAFLTALNTACRAFLGGVWVSGDISEPLRVPLFNGRTVDDVIKELGGKYCADPIPDIPTIVIGSLNRELSAQFCIRIFYNSWQAGCLPAHIQPPFETLIDNPLAGVAAAALGVNEAFLHVRKESPDAGEREVGLSLWRPDIIDNWHSSDYSGPKIGYLPASLWLVGLGHLGQAYAWTIGMLPYPEAQRPYLVLQDVDTVSESNFSTCLFVYPEHIGLRKTRLISSRLESIGAKTDIVERRITDTQKLIPGDPTTALFGVDNILARRAIESVGFGLVVEAGLGSGFRDFRNIRSHTFPGPRKAIEIWTAFDGVSQAIKLTPTYERMVEASNDRCGIIQLATRAVATPFVGAFASALVVGDLMRVLHGGGLYATTDIQMKDLRFRIVAQDIEKKYLLPDFIKL